ncbi:MAG: type IV pilus biogenesis/stability protein PilW [Burkholderiaceae bacterium]|nr:type IV pilus biogenesis/stability protein PilW [Burkholderiaceae bacterium]
MRSTTTLRRAGRWAAALVLGTALAGCATPEGTTPASSANKEVATVIPQAANETEQRRRARIRLELAANYYQQGNFNVALDELRHALEVDPGYAAAYGVLGLVYRDLGDLDRAEDSFQRGLQLAPGDPDLNNNYGWFLCQTGRERKSIDYFLRALKDPLYATPAKPLHNAGLCSLRLGDEAAAEGYFQRAFQVDPANAVAMFNLGELYLKRRDFERAHFYAQRLLTTYAPTAQTTWLALRVAHARGDRDTEASLAAQLRRRFPTSPEAGLLAAGKFGG